MLRSPRTNPALMRFLRCEIPFRRAVLAKTESVPVFGRDIPVKTALNLVLIFVLASCTGPALSQTPPEAADMSDVRIVSSFVPVGAPVPEECREEAHVFARSLIRYPRPGSWHWVMFCDEAGWRRFLRLSGRDEQAEIYASTDLERADDLSSWR